MKVSIYQIVFHLALLLLIGGCATTSTSFEPKPGSVWPTETIQLIDDVTVTKSYGFSAEETINFPGASGRFRTPMEYTLLTMPAGTWTFERALGTHVVKTENLEKDPDWWHKNVTKDNHVYLGHKILIPGLGLVSTYKGKHSQADKHWADSAVFYSAINLIIDHNLGEVSKSDSKEYLGVIIKESKDSAIASRAVLIPKTSNLSGKKQNMTQTLVLNENGLQKLDLIPIYDSTHKKNYHEYVDDYIHFMTVGGNNKHNLKSHWLGKDGSVTIKEDLFFTEDKTPEWNQYNKVYFTTVDGGVESIFRSSSSKYLSHRDIKQLKSISSKAIPIRHKGWGDYMKGRLMGFLVSNEDKNKGTLFGWRDANFNYPTDFIWDEVDLDPIDPDILLGHQPGKGWAAYKFSNPNHQYTYKGLAKGFNGKQAVFENALRQKKEASQQEEAARKLAIRKSYERQKKLQEEANQARAYLDAISNKRKATSSYQSSSKQWDKYKKDAEARRKEALRQQRERDLKNKIFKDKKDYN